MLRWIIQTLNASNCQVGVGQAVAGGADLAGFKKTDLAVNE